MEIRIKKTFSLQELMLWVGVFCVISFVLLEHMSISIPVFSVIKTPLLYMGAICVAFQINELIRNIFKKRYFYALAVLLLMFGFLVCSMVVNRDAISGFSPVRGTIRLILCLTELFLLAIQLTEKGKIWTVIKFIFRYILVLVLLTDFLMLTGLARFYMGRHECYLVGTKFTVIYLHMDLAVLWLMLRWKQGGERQVSKWFIAISLLIFIWVSFRVDCMSGLLGSCVLAALLMWLNAGNKSKVKLLTSPLVFLICIVCSVIFPFVIGAILDIPFISNFIEDVLGRSTTLTGRTIIYQQFAKRMQGHWWLGYGAGSSNLASMSLFGYSNTQNAVLDWILESGILTTASLICVMAVILRQVDNDKMDKATAIGPFLALIYMYIFLGMVETTFSMSFILWWVLVFMMVNQHETEEGIR